MGRGPIGRPTEDTARTGPDFETKPVFRKCMTQNYFRRNPPEAMRKSTEPIAIHAGTLRKDKEGPGAGPTGLPRSLNIVGLPAR